MTGLSILGRVTDAHDCTKMHSQVKRRATMTIHTIPRIYLCSNYFSFVLSIYIHASRNQESMCLNLHAAKP